MSVKVSPQAGEGLSQVDPIWFAIRREAEEIVTADPAMASFVHATVLKHDRLEDAVVHRVAQRLESSVVGADVVRGAFDEALTDQPELGEIFRCDIAAVYDRDPACDRHIEPLLYFKGFHAIQAHRLAHWLWSGGRRDLALFLQSRSSAVFQVDIHPQVPLGRSIFLDHATGLVVGRTAVIEDNVSILQDVTLGGTGKEIGDRHPKIRHGVLIGAGAKILGNIEVGASSKIAAGSVVLHPVEAHTTVAGVPAKVVSRAGQSDPARLMDQLFDECADD
jgi:serine O-acetyltransferase